MAQQSSPESLFVSLLALQWSEPFWKLQLAAFMVFFTLCWVEGLSARPRRPPLPERPLVTDMFYWMLIPSVRVVSRIAAAVVLVPLALLLGLEAGPQLWNGFGPIAQQPRLLIAIELLVLVDLSSYWTHRAFHRFPALWRFHAIHHSAKLIRWATTGRVHPVNEAVNYLVSVVPFFLVGFPIKAVLPLIPFVVAYAVAAHANWNPSFGPFKKVLASPRYHRWHHTHSDEGGNKNFANMFAFWDLLFGTYYLPEDRIAQDFGLDDDDVPEGYLGQLAYPFRKTRAQPARSSDGGEGLVGARKIEL